MTGEERCDRGGTGLCRLAQDLLQLYQDHTAADITFVIGDKAKVFHAHFPIIWARCRLLQQHLTGLIRRKTNIQASLTFPHYDSHLFEEVLQYIYTGVVELNDYNVLSVLSMASELGLPELLTLAQDYIIQGINPENVCLYLKSATEMESTTKGMVMEGSQLGIDLETVGRVIVEECIGYIERHAQCVICTNGWLDLPKPVLIQLIKSQTLGLDEDKVWHGVISWGRRQAGISQHKPLAELSIQERGAMAQVLGCVMQHINFMEIESALFVREVEPSGLVPINTILERYRHAALSEHHTDLSLPEKHNFFEDSHILSNHEHLQALLNHWCGQEKQRWKLLYRASEHRFSAQAFHTHCDGQSPTFVILKGTSGCVCGGYSDVPWSSSSNTPTQGQFIPSHRAFLFTLINNQGIPPAKYDVTNSVLATLHHPRYGPVFGGGADLCITDQCDTGMTSYSNFPHSYAADQRGPCVILMGDYSFNITQYEVYTLLG